MLPSHEKPAPQPGHLPSAIKEPAQLKNPRDYGNQEEEQLKSMVLRIECARDTVIELGLCE
jgi:hypothetical protein